MRSESGMLVLEVDADRRGARESDTGGLAGHTDIQVLWVPGWDSARLSVGTLWNDSGEHEYTQAWLSPRLAREIGEALIAVAEAAER